MEDDLLSSDYECTSMAPTAREGSVQRKELLNKDASVIRAVECCDVESD